ncbi:MAG: GNAT family N-acetyltransferase [Streptomycetales bacterium]
MGWCWRFLGEENPDYQFVLHDEDADRVVAAGYTGPIVWDGVDARLPDSFDEAIVQVVNARRTGKPVDTLCAMAAEIPPLERSRGLAAEVLRGMREIAARHGLARIVAPVRPSWKERYPLAPIERYVTWRREDGTLLDPWMRVHERLGARVARRMPQSLRITGTVAEWESWTGMALPETASYVFPRGLAPLQVDREADRCTYWEPNVWVVHPDVV